MHHSEKILKLSLASLNLILYLLNKLSFVLYRDEKKKKTISNLDFGKLGKFSFTFGLKSFYDCSVLSSNDSASRHLNN